MVVNIIHDEQKRKDRRILLESEIREQGLTVRYWPALYDPVMSFRGINLAHKQIIRHAMQQDLEMVCVAEDDLHFPHPGAWQYYVDHIPTDFDLYLSGIYCGVFKPDNTVVDFCGLHLYIVHKRFYPVFLAIDEKAHLDRALAGRGRYVVANPICAVQRAGWSDNKKGYYDYGYIIERYNKEGIPLCCETL